MDDGICPTGASRLRRLLSHGGPVLAYAALIFYLSSLSRFPEPVSFDFGFDKVAHFAEYFLFGALLYRWVFQAGVCSARWCVLGISIFIGTLYALGDEWHQSFVPGRDASLWDVLFDVFGVGAGAAAFPAIRGKLSSVRRRLPGEDLP